MPQAPFGDHSKLHHPVQDGHLREAVDVADLDSLDLPPVFLPVEAATVLRKLGLAEMTECALRTRAYRKQVPFHLNGRRIVFTLGDLREIAEGAACRPLPRADAAARDPAPRPTPRRRSARRSAEAQPTSWRARKPPGPRPNADSAGSALDARSRGAE
ncbi:MAG: hypothetical protein ACRDPY_19170 [Streptosporangiaceae bacterium]